MEFVHLPVLFRETVDSLAVKPDGLYVDGTVGGAGHSREIARQLTTGHLIALDQDPDAVAVATERLADYPATVIKSNFSQMASVLHDLGIEAVDGIMMDLGVSSHQLDEGNRGFSYHKEAPLDMRMSQSGTSAADLVATLSASELADIFTRFGEEKFAYRIASAIVKEREQTPILTTLQLADLISRSVPAAARRDGHPARKCFQALRIAVNGELDILEDAVTNAFHCLKVGGRLSIITFHSLEDRLVKQTFAKLSAGCICPPDIPVCICGRTPEGRPVNRKPIVASAEELAANPRSRSAKLRTIERLK